MLMGDLLDAALSNGGNEIHHGGGLARSFAVLALKGKPIMD
jgi:hypothetical protein